ncbi:hypothetical protein [Cupriavidus sp. H39]
MNDEIIDAIARHDADAAAEIVCLEETRPAPAVSSAPARACAYR